MVEILNTKNIVAVTAMANVIKKLANVMSYDEAALSIEWDDTPDRTIYLPSIV